MMWATVVSGTAAALRLALTPAPRPVHTVELSAAGWSPAALRRITAALTVVLGVAVGAAVAAFTTANSGGFAAVAVSVWVPVFGPVLVRGAVLSPFRVRRDAALLDWLRRIRLYVAAGRPINNAAVEAAERVVSSAFAPAAASINLALSAGSDPLTAAAPHFAGSSAETLVATLAEAEKGGAAAADLIDRLVTQAVNALEDGRRVRIEDVGRSIPTAATLISVVASVVVIVALLAGVQLGV
ncbi:MAG: hypothetical protein OXG41_01240 [Acidimicrobiaceae bacterium]|nr:hypothetical protein [Acidimicrobiaceae bacterium]